MLLYPVCDFNHFRYWFDISLVINHSHVRSYPPSNMRFHFYIANGMQWTMNSRWGTKCNYRSINTSGTQCRIRGVIHKAIQCVTRPVNLSKPQTDLLYKTATLLWVGLSCACCLAFNHVLCLTCVALVHKNWTNSMFEHLCERHPRIHILFSLLASMLNTVSCNQILNGSGRDTDTQNETGMLLHWR